MKLVGKIFIRGAIEAITGLRIGGNKSSLEIGGVDLNVIKTGRGVPYLPGSSIKGKMRSLLAKVRGKLGANEDTSEMKALFGDAGGSDVNSVTRLFVRDAHLDEKKFEGVFGKKGEHAMDFDFSEVKTENTIDRSRGTALHPRQIERVPAGAQFDFEMMIDVYDSDNAAIYLKLVDEAFQLLNMDYLGGHGSRGSGKVSVVINEISGKKISAEGITSMDGQLWKGIFE